MQPFLALITPLSGGGSPGEPPGIWGPTDPRPTPPIVVPPGGAYPQPPLGIWGPTDPRPTNPIAGMGPGGNFPQPPLGIWGPTDPRPTPPIYIPPEGSPPPLGIWGPPDMPPGFWGGGMGPGVKPQPRPEHPIVIPPDLPPTTPEGGKIEWKTAWTPQTGWIVVGIPAEGTLVPTPSKG